ncbi:aminotransferase class III-fold pyridoxal phosphate-dependent enzyme [Ensifer sp. ENS11]|uniref:aminotransferase class III-fold pyridoxal phosphate-dependent enzyme n=1 Tax=Ensifer sp. ENS11 TaxID=2769291 RepID=UPI00177AA5A2|nr:aminotransferase class III-fold pyridoxal phosphate-dependent enzyme [Ensifer sp. ENS11]MBD9490503.1 aminotransferase class III-fold pyridoxal phosphate-dependent enzyme [Ensifer sp. ENS11]MDP9633039.1 glutamate-1-semialdehyde 2,1-aminomutase [Ensifer adhaerens]
MVSLAASGVCQFFLSSGEPILFKEGSGAIVTDTKGRSYYDFILGFGPVVLGHARRDFASLVQEQTTGAIHFPGYSEQHIDFLNAYFPDAYREHSAGYFKHSSDAITAASRLACKETGRTGLIRCGYIGWHDAQIGKSPRWHERLSSPHRGEIRPNSFTRGMGEREPVVNWIDLKIDSLRQMIDDAPGAYAALLFDAYQLSLMSPSHLREALTLCRDRGIRVVADETKTAGRVSPMGALAAAGLEADYIVLGKAIGNGAPVSLLLGPQAMATDYLEAKISGTYCKELLGVFAASATLHLMNALNGYSMLAGISERFRDVFNTAAANVGLGNQIYIELILGGSLFEVRFSDEFEVNLELRAKIPRIFADHGVLLLQGHPSFFCLSHADIDWADLSARIERALTASLPLFA